MNTNDGVLRGKLALASTFTTGQHDLIGRLDVLHVLAQVNITITEHAIALDLTAWQEAEERFSAAFAKKDSKFPPIASLGLVDPLLAIQEYQSVASDYAGIVSGEVSTAGELARRLINMHVQVIEFEKDNDIELYEEIKTDVPRHRFIVQRRCTSVLRRIVDQIVASVERVAEPVLRDAIDGLEDALCTQASEFAAYYREHSTSTQ
ncbi:hypothetical protein QKT49_gp319 [Acanthamoeba castellanii medusavirus]|uniref:Uncharacterized protein n=1 Tax=Acanthamoeba castellanii medusavirus J1 TaxID=3114988 RepID=A0A3T1CX92_9VIRU|nr:hypothetical protein QKT49_gp319 [Acanthamoeba castellanii medusavirus]BBI30444.1 hypothetical protein [Acanthamoeba castellanii medusavirus J1]